MLQFFTTIYKLGCFLGLYLGGSWLFISVAWAQAASSVAVTGTGTVKGQITSADGQPVDFVNISVKEAPLGTTSNEKGAFTLPNVPAGPQTLIISAIGFAPQEQGIDIKPNETATVSLALAATTKQLSEVVVTGQRRRTSSATKTNQELLDIPMAVQVIGQDVIQQQQAFDMQTIARNVSSINLTATYAGQNSYQFFNSRGFDMNNWQNYRRNGLMVWNMGTHFNDNIESVEFLKGPTAILYGDVAPGGVMNFVTKKPLGYDYRRFELKVGQYGLLRPTFDLSGPLNAKKTLLYRVNTTYERSRSFRNQVQSEALMFTPTITWNITPKLDWNVEYTFKQTAATDDPGLVSPDGTFRGLAKISEKTFLGEPTMQYRYSDQSLFSTISYRLGSNWRLRNVSCYGYTTRIPYGITLNNPDENGNLTRFEYNFRQWFDNRSTSMEILGEVVTGPVRHVLLFGGDYMSSFSRFSASAGYNQLDSTINIYNPVYGIPRISYDNSPYGNYRFFYQRTGLYVQDQLSTLNDKWHLLLGLRYNITRQGNRYDNEADRPADDQEVRVNPISPRIGLVYKPVDWLSAYASFTRSYEVNTPDLLAENGSDFASPKPTYGTQLEAGLKGNLFQERLGVTLTAFQINKTDIFGYYYENPADPGAADYRYYLYDGGHHRSRGLELDVNGKVTNELSLIASAAYIDARIVNDPAYEKGKLLRGTPRESFSLWAHYTPLQRLKGLFVGYGIFHRSAFYGTNENLYQTEGYTTMDASVGYTYRGITAQVNVSNLTNKVYYLQYWSANVWEPQWTRRAVLSVAYKF